MITRAINRPRMARVHVRYMCVLLTCDKDLQP